MDLNRIFVSNNGGGNFLSEDSGRTWTDQWIDGRFGIPLNPSVECCPPITSFAKLYQLLSGLETKYPIIMAGGHMGTKGRKNTKKPKQVKEKKAQAPESKKK